jgi:hypothetical protein
MCIFRCSIHCESPKCQWTTFSDRYRASCWLILPHGEVNYIFQKEHRVNGYVSDINSTICTNRKQVVPTTIHVMFAGIIIILSFFNYESPRCLVKISQDDKATINLARVRNLPIDHVYVMKEISDIQQQLQGEQEATLGQGWLGVLKEMFLMPNNFYRIYLGPFSQLRSQWSGAQSITIYAPEFFALLGTEGQNEKLFATAIFGVVKFVAAIICVLFLVGVIGRKRSLGIGITLQAFSMCYIASYLTAVPTLAEGEKFTSS